MRRTGKAAVVSAVVLGALGFGGVGVAQAEDLPLPIDVVVELDRTAPATGELVRGVRDIEGYAEAPEGVTRVDLYVVRHSLTNPVTGGQPVMTFRPSMPLGRASFDFHWDSAKTPSGLVDVVVVATTTTTRSAEARVISVRVEHVARQATAPVASKPTVAKKSSKTAAPRTPAAQSAAQMRASVLRKLAASPVNQAAQAKQAEAFYAAFGAEPELAVEAKAAAATPSVLAPLKRASRGVWPSVAIGLVLLVAAGHVQRAVRVSLA